MIAKTITYTDYNGNERTETYHFNLTAAELIEMGFTAGGGMDTILRQAVDTNDVKRLCEIFKDILIKSYGVKSLDGKHFIKNQENIDDFIYSEAYSYIFTELATNPQAATDFINKVVPPKHILERNG